MDVILKESGRNNIITSRTKEQLAEHRTDRLSEKSFVLFNIFYSEIHTVDLWQVYGIAEVAVGSNPV